MLKLEISIIVYLTEMLISYIFFSSISEKRFGQGICITIGALLFGMGAVINVTFANNIIINAFISIVINLLFSSICFYQKLTVSVFYSVILVVISAVCEFIMISLISALTKTHFFSYNNDFAIFMLECPISKLLYFFAVLILRKIKQPHHAISAVPINFLLHPTAIIVCLVIFWIISSQNGITADIQQLLVISSMILLLSTVLLFVTYQHQIEKDSEAMRIKNEYAKLQTEKNYFDILEKQNQQLMQYAHDAKNHMAAISSLNSDPRISSYINKLSSQLSEYTRHCHSGNQLLDVIIHKYSIECEMRGIDFTYDVKLCNLSTLEDIDLVAILGNLMDNAVDAASHSAKKEVILATGVRNTYSIVVVSNSCDAPPNTKNGHLVTMKTDSDAHGYGLKSVRKTLKKYEGDFEWEYDSVLCHFTITAMIGHAAGN